MQRAAQKWRLATNPLRHAMFLAVLLLSRSLLYFIAETVAWPGRVLVTPHLLFGPLVMHLCDGGYLFCGWPPRSLSWNRTPLPHCPLPARPPYPPGIKKRQNIPWLSSSSSCLRRIMVEGDMRLSAVFIFYITGDARLGFFIC